MKAFFAGSLAVALFSIAVVRADPPRRLRCEWGMDPLGIDRAQPHLTWEQGRMEGGRPAARWQVLAASRPEILAANQGDLWDSGPQAVMNDPVVIYAGQPLHSWQTVWWKVRTLDAGGQPSAWSQPAQWTMGILSPSEWPAKWIAAPGETESLLLRREFVVRPKLVRALVCVSGLGQYQLFCNGGRPDADFLSPGWTTYARTTLYDMRDITAWLRTGRNAIGLLLGNGMYDVILRNRYTKFTGFSGPSRAILALRLDYADGTVDWVGTDEQWTTRAGPLTFDSIYGGDDEDARLVPAGWARPGFDDRDWLRAVGYLGSRDTLRGYTAAAPPMREFAEQPVAAAKTLPDGSVVYDFGQNAAHVPRVTLEGPAGASVRLTPSEIVNPDGSIDRSTMGGVLRGSSYWTFTKATDQAETWSPPFCYIGFRYLHAELRPPAEGGAAPRIRHIAAVVVHSDASPVGRFDASNPLLARIDRLVWWSQVSNLASVFTDCPHREKLGWLEQVHLNGPALRYHFDLARNFRKTVHDMADAQTPDGLVPATAPEYVKFDPPFRAAAEWGSAFILVPWQQYVFTGDPSLLRENYAGMQRYLGYLQSRAADGIVSEGLGDWYDLGPLQPGFAQLTGPDITSTAFYFTDARLLAQIAALLGDRAGAARYSAQAEEIRRSFNRHFWHADRGCYGGDSQCANAMALAMGLAEPGDRPRVLGALVRDIEARGYRLTAGDIGYRYLLLALAEGGRSDVIYRMIDQDQTPGYAYQLRMGATSLTEAWDANPHASWNHFMLGQIVEWFYGWLAGIAPDPSAPGFRHIVFQPQPVGDLAWASAEYQSVRGVIRSRWSREAGHFRLVVDIPHGCTGEVHLPDGTVRPAAAGEHAFSSSCAP